MIIKKAKTKKVQVWREEVISDEVYGCDCCKKELKNHSLEITVFNHDTVNDYGETAPRFKFCSWICVFKYLQKVKSNYFVCLPYLHFDISGATSAKEFLKLIKKLLP